MEIQNKAVFVILLALNLLQPSSSTICTNASFVSYLDSVLAEYDREVAPLLPIIGISVNIRHVNLNEDDFTARFLADIYLDWTDQRLKWDATEWGCNSTQINPERLYQPDLRVMTLGATLGSATDPLPVHVSSTGDVTWVNRLDLHVPVAIDLKWWPNDVQKLKVVFGTPSVSSNETSKLLIPIMRQFVGLGDSSGFWKWAVSTTAAMSIMDMTGDSRDVVVVSVEVKRMAPAHGLATGATLVTALLALAAAGALPPDSRAPLCACSAFIASIWLISCLLRLPHPSSTPVCLSLMGAVCVLAALVACCAGVADRVQRQSGAPAAWVKYLLTLASRFCSLTPEENSTSESGAWAAAAKLLDLVFTSLMLLTVLIIFIIYFSCFVV